MKLYQAARQYKDTPFRHQGRSKNGLDCLGLLLLAARDIGKPLADLRGYGANPDGVEMRKQCEKQLIHSDNDAIEPDCILLMRFARLPQHIAIVTDQGMIHCFANIGKVVEHEIDDFWRNAIVSRGVYKLG